MAAVDPTEADAVDTSAWSAVDGTFQADLLSCLTDDTLTAACNVGSVSKIGKTGSPHGRVLRLRYDGSVSTPVDGNTITCDVEVNHQVGTMAMLAYTSSNTVTETDKVTVAWGTGPRILTFTTAFIAQLGDLGSGDFAVRIVEDAGSPGDWQVSEVDADLDAAGGGPEPDEPKRHIHAPDGAKLVHGPGGPGLINQP